MKFFGIGQAGAPDPAKLERQKASVAAIQAGGLPLDAVDRLQDLAARQGTDRHLFTSDLSVNEAVLTGDCGFEPLGQVMGSCVYHVGWQYWGAGYSWYARGGELDVLTQAYYDARHLALGRLQEEARLLRATGVVGVRLVTKGGDWGDGLVEFQAIGTAVRETSSPPVAEGAMPFLSRLSGQDHWSLRVCGLRPVGVCLGNCSYYAISNWRTQYALSGGWRNIELTDFTGAFYQARELAMNRMDAEGRHLAAAGVVGTEITYHHEIMEQGENSPPVLMIHYTAVGTAVAFEPHLVRAPSVSLALPLTRTNRT